MAPTRQLLCALFLMLAATGAAFAEHDPTPAEADWEARVSLDFTDSPIEAILEEIGSAGNLRFVFDDKFDAGALASVSLSDVSVLDALRFVTRSNRLFFVDRGGAMVFVSPDTRQKRQQHVVEALRTFRLEHADPKTVITVLRSLLQARSLVQDEQLNTVTMKDTSGQLDTAEVLISHLDLSRSPGPDAPERQPLWVGNAFNQDMGSIGGPFPRLDVAMDRVVAFESTDATVRDLYDNLAQATGIQFVFAGGVDLHATAPVAPSAMPAAAALEELDRQLHHFHVVWGPRTVFISPDERWRRMADEQVGVQFFYLDHAEPKAVITAVRTMIQSRQIAEIPRLNAVVIKDNEANLEAAAELIARMDRAKTK